MNFEEYLDRMGTETTDRYDVSPLFADPGIFETLRSDLLSGLAEEPTTVVGIDALGFVIGGALATELDVGFVPVRKGGKLPYTDGSLLRREFTDYSGSSKALELHPDALGPDDRALIVDDWIETGAQMRATTELVEMAGASVNGIAAIGVDRNQDTKPLFERYTVHSLQSP